MSGWRTRLACATRMQLFLSRHYHSSFSSFSLPAGRGYRVAGEKKGRKVKKRLDYFAQNNHNGRKSDIKP